MAKRKKQSSKVQKKKGAAARPKAKVARGKVAAKRTVSKAKPKRAPAKKAAEAVVPAVETGAGEHPAPEFEEVSQVTPGPDQPEE